MIYAIINNNITEQIREITQEEFDQGIVNKNQAILDVTDLTPEPCVGWLYNGINLNPVIPSSKISKLAMLMRFSVPERLAILSYTNANPSSVPSVLLQNILIATFVDLNRADTSVGINYLVVFGLITQQRAVEILTASPTQEELYKGKE